MEKWFVAAKRADFDAWSKKFHISAVLARILRNRDLTEDAEIEKFLHGSLKDCYSPWLLKDMDRAVEHILEAIEQGTTIRVIGDYDVDGICASYILTKGLQTLGAKADTAIPHRIHDGYGLNESLIEEAKADGVGLIVTCDNGIAAAPQIALANSLGIKVIVTDHHEVPFTMEGDVRREILPDALAVVNPKQEQCTYPFSGICGGVVAYKVMAALAEKTESAALAEAMEEFLEFAAFSTVCDVMELKDENRIIVKEGLKRLRKTGNIGLRALMEVNNMEPAKLGAYHLGFVLGPCLNATGRLDTAKRALELLQSRTKVEAYEAAKELKELNDSRKNLTLKGVEEAVKYIEDNQMTGDKVMVVYLPEVHESLAGIIAGRIRERYNHPVFVLTKGEEGVKGSGRSVEGYHMYEAMTEVGHLFSKFGGHAMAAGLSMKIEQENAVEADCVEREEQDAQTERMGADALAEKKIRELRRELNARCTLTEEDFVPKVHIDVPMPMEYANEQIADELELLEPFGVGNPKPLFAQKDLIFCAGYKLGANKAFARFTVQTPDGQKRKLMYFGDLEKFGAFLEQKYGEGSERALYEGRGHYAVSVVYQLGKNTYMGKTEVQYVMQNYC